MTLLLGTAILVGVIVGGGYLYVQAGRLERDIRRQAGRRREEEP